MQRELINSIVVGGCPFPSVGQEGLLRDGIAIPQPNECKGCPSKRCMSLYEMSSTNRLVFDTCYRGFGVARAVFGQESIVLNGLIFPSIWLHLPRKKRKNVESQKLNESQVTDWFEKSLLAIQNAEKEIQLAIDDTLGMFHDVQTSVSSIIRAEEEYINQQPGNSEEEKMEKLSPAATTVYKATQLLQRRFALMPLLKNPTAATYGKKYPIPVYKVINLIVRILRPISDEKGITVRLNGASYNKVFGFQSFETIPLVLIENAIKYSVINQVVDVTVEDLPNGVRVRISSISPIIPREEQDRLFERGFRTKAAIEVTPRGSGLGLYLAQVVAKAHGFEITHTCGEPTTVIEGIAYGKNTFEFIFPG